MKAILEETQKPRPRIIRLNNNNNATTKIEVPSFMKKIMGKGMKKKKKKIGMVNMMDEFDTSEWKVHGETIPVNFQRVSEYFKWQDLFPEWIDEEEETETPSCPEIPMPDFSMYDDNSMDVIVAKLPCEEEEEEGWRRRRDVFRLQVHLIAANFAVKKGKRDSNNRRTKVVLWSKCRPMLEIFRCDDLVKREGEYWWYYEPEMARLEHKVSLPIGSCQLALPLWGQGMPSISLFLSKKNFSYFFFV